MFGSYERTSQRGPELFRGALVLGPKTRGIPEIMVSRILMFMWSFGLLLLACISRVL